MAEAPIKITHELRPLYYDRFQCLTADCKIDCCRGWRIAFDKKDYFVMKNARCSPELRERLGKALKRMRGNETFYAEFRAGGDCPLHREDGLCALQLELGPDALPKVCKTFPRAHRYSYSGYLERSLSPACEAVLKLLWELPEGVDFVSDPLERKDHKELRPPADQPLLPYYQEIRSLCIDILQDRRMTLPERLMLLGLRLQRLAEGEEDIPRWLRETQGLLDSDGTPELSRRLLPERDGGTKNLWLSNNIRELTQLQVLNPALSGVRGSLLESLHVQATVEGDQARFVIPSAAPYEQAKARFQETFGDRAYFFENLVVSLFFHLGFPVVTSPEMVWRSYVDTCNLYSLFYFMAMMSCREGAAGDREELFRLLVLVSRSVLHNRNMQTQLRDQYFQNDSATLAHMALLVSG